MQPVLSIYIYFYEYLNTALTVHCKQQYVFNYFINFTDFLFNFKSARINFHKSIKIIILHSMLFSAI